MSNQNRVPAGVPSGGQFAQSTKTEAGVALASESSELERAVAHIPKHVTVYFVDRGDRLTDDEIDALLAGNEMGASNSAADRFDDSVYEYASNDAKEAWEAAHAAGDVDTEWDDLDYEVQDEMRWAVTDADTTDLVEDLARNTPSVLMRTHLAADLGSRLDGAPAGTWNGLSTFNEEGPEADARREARYSTIEDLLAKHGIDTANAEVTEAVRELVDNGPYDWHEGVDLDVIFYDDVTTGAADPTPGSVTSLTFNNAHVVLIDTMNGSGHDVRIPGTLTRTFAPMPDDEEEGGLDPEHRAFADAGPSSRMSWDDVCGLHKPAYKTSVTRTVAGTEGAVA